MGALASRSFRALALGLAATAPGCTLLVLDADALQGGTLQPGAADGASPTDAPGEANADPNADADAAGPTERYAIAVRADAPILYVRMGDAPGTIAKAEFGADGSYTVAGVSQGKPGALSGDPNTAAELTDGAGRITFPDGPDTSFTGLASFSVELWAKPASSNTLLGFIVDHSEWTDRRGWNLLLGTDQTGFERWAGDGGLSTIGAAPVTAGVWHHVVATFDGSTQRLYVDGARVEEGSSSLSLPPRNSTLTIGHQNCTPCTATAFRGEVDELAVYDKALTDAQVGTHWAAR